MKYERLTNNNIEEYNPEYDFCVGCKYFGEPNGCNRPNGTCGNYERFIETYNRLVELEDKIECGELVENKVVTYINMARSDSKTLIDKAIKYDKLKDKIENGTLIEMPRIIHPNKAEWYVQYQYPSGVIQYDICFSQAEAEQKLKELEE